MRIFFPFSGFHWSYSAALHQKYGLRLLRLPFQTKGICIDNDSIRKYMVVVHGTRFPPPFWRWSSIFHQNSSTDIADALCPIRDGERRGDERSRKKDKKRSLGVEVRWVPAYPEIHAAAAKWLLPLLPLQNSDRHHQVSREREGGIKLIRRIHTYIVVDSAVQWTCWLKSFEIVWDIFVGRLCGGVYFVVV